MSHTIDIKPGTEKFDSKCALVFFFFEWFCQNSYQTDIVDE